MRRDVRRDEDRRVEFGRQALGQRADDCAAAGGPADYDNVTLVLHRAPLAQRGANPIGRAAFQSL